MSRVLPVLLFALAISAPAAASRSDWTPEEVRCAQTLGIELNADPDPGSAHYLKRLAWLAELVVYGKVAKIRKDVGGAYDAKVRIDVLSVRKGRLPTGPLTVALTSEAVHVRDLDRLLEVRAVDDPPFASGETVLLFLTRGHRGTASREGPSYDLPEDVFRLVNSSKLRIDGVTATLQGWGSGTYNVVRSDYEIRRVVAAQSTNCR